MDDKISLSGLDSFGNSNRHSYRKHSAAKYINLCKINNFCNISIENNYLLVINRVIDYVKYLMVLVWFIVFNATFNNISVILWQSVLLVEETGVSGENHWPVASHWQTLSHNVSSSPRLSRVRTHNVSGDRHWWHRYSPFDFYKSSEKNS